MNIKTKMFSYLIATYDTMLDKHLERCELENAYYRSKNKQWINYVEYKIIANDLIDDMNLYGYLYIQRLCANWYVNDDNCSFCPYDNCEYYNSPNKYL
jgi:hypothetical protein